jgi:hypothetical protein
MAETGTPEQPEHRNNRNTGTTGTPEQPEHRNNRNDPNIQTGASIFGEWGGLPRCPEGFALSRRIRQTGGHARQVCVPVRSSISKRKGFY